MAGSSTKRTARNRPRRTQAERRQKSTAKILQAAAQLFAQQGYDRTTLAQIAQSAGCSSGLVAHRFGSKGELVKALVLDIQERSAQRITELQLESCSAVEGVGRLIDLYLEAGLKDKPLRAFFVLMAESAGPLREMRDLFAEHNRVLVALYETAIQRGQTEGEISSSIDAYETSLEIAGLLRGVTLLWLIDPRLVDPRAFFEKKRGEILAKLSG